MVRTAERSSLRSPPRGSPPRPSRPPSLLPPPPLCHQSPRPAQPRYSWTETRFCQSRTSICLSRAPPLTQWSQASPPPTPLTAAPLSPAQPRPWCQTARSYPPSRTRLFPRWRVCRQKSMCPRQSRQLSDQHRFPQHDPPARQCYQHLHHQELHQVTQDLRMTHLHPVKTPPLPHKKLLLEDSLELLVAGLPRQYSSLRLLLVVSRLTLAPSLMQWPHFSEAPSGAPSPTGGTPPP